MLKDKIALKWAALLFTATLAWIGFEKQMGWHDELIADHAHFANIYDILFILIFALAFWDKKNQTSDKFNWKTGFLYGTYITIYITALVPITQSIYHLFISPQFFPHIIELAVRHHLLSVEEAQEQFNLTSYIAQNIIGTSLLGLFTSAFMSWIFKRK